MLNLSRILRPWLDGGDTPADVGIISLTVSSGSSQLVGAGSTALFNIPINIDLLGPINGPYPYVAFAAPRTPDVPEGGFIASSYITIGPFIDPPARGLFAMLVNPTADDLTFFPNASETPTVWDVVLIPTQYPAGPPP